MHSSQHHTTDGLDGKRDRDRDIFVNDFTFIHMAEVLQMQFSSSATQCCNTPISFIHIGRRKRNETAVEIAMN